MLSDMGEAASKRGKLPRPIEGERTVGDNREPNGGEHGANARPKSPRVFISYTHDSDEHKRRVKELADGLRADGIEAFIDQYIESPDEGWPRWTSKQIEDSDFVLVVCTALYKARFRGEEPSDAGLGGVWEGGLITQEVYSAKGMNQKFIPVIVRTEDEQQIPLFLAPFTHYDLEKNQYEHLYRRLTNPLKVTMPPLGDLRVPSTITPDIPNQPEEA